MPRRKINFENNEYYHIYNRGVDKQKIVRDSYDIKRFVESLNIFNTTENVGSIYEYSRLKKDEIKNKFGTRGSKLIEIVAFNILNNHYHLVLKQEVDSGVSKFMQSVGGGLAKYINEKNERCGPLFQGSFKAEHIDSDEYLNYVVAYVNLNHVVHKLGTPSSKWGFRSSWEQYVNKKDEWENNYFECKTNIVLGKFRNMKDYKKDAIGVVNYIIEKRGNGNLKTINHLELGVPKTML